MDIKKKNWFVRHKVWTVILAVIVLFIVIGAANGSKQPQASQPAQADKSSSTSATTSTQATAPAKPATPQTLLDLSGSGTKQTQKFTAAGNWDLTWSYDCSAFGSQGNFQVMVYDDNGSLDTDNGLVNQLGANGSDVQHYYKGGTFYLSVNSECSWHVTVKG